MNSPLISTRTWLVREPARPIRRRMFQLRPARSSEGSFWLALTLSFSRSWYFCPAMKAFRSTLKLFLGAVKDVLPRRRTATKSKRESSTEDWNSTMAGNGLVEA